MHKVLVYGTLKKGFSNHRRLESSKLLNDNVFFTGTMASLGAFPCCTQHGNTKIKGELYEVDDDTLRSLDSLESHPSFYERKVVHTSAGPAWVYLIDEPHRYEQGARIVKSGVWGEMEEAA